MRQLHLVGFTPDGTGLVLAGRPGADGATYVLPLDDHLLSEVDRVRRQRRATSRGRPADGSSPDSRRTSDRPRARVQSRLSPRDIQARLRGGRTVAEVAAEAEVAEDWIERFAAPIMAEQAAEIAKAQSLTLTTSRRGESDRPLAAAVARNLIDRGVRMTPDELDAAWSASYYADDQWIVRFRFRARGRDHEAEWLLDSRARAITGLNKLATDLGFVDRARHVHDPPVTGPDDAPDDAGSDRKESVGRRTASPNSQPERRATGAAKAQPAKPRPRPAEPARPAKGRPTRAEPARPPKARAARPPDGATAEPIPLPLDPMPPEQPVHARRRGENLDGGGRAPGH